MTKKRLEAERLYHLQKEKIKELLNQVDDFLEDENLDKEIDATTLFEAPLDDEEQKEEQEELDLFAGEEEKVKDSLTQIEVVKIENIVAKTGSASPVPVNYFISSEKELTREENNKEEQQEENTKHLSRVEDDIFL